MTIDMRAVIVPKSDQMNADDLIGGNRTITVEKVSIRPGTEQPCSIHYAGDNNKPYKPCKSMARVLVQLWGADANNYIGRSMTLYNDPKVTWAGMAVGGIRISHMSHIDETANLMLTATKGSRKPFVVQPLQGGASKPPPKQEQSGIDIDNLLANAHAAAGEGDASLKHFWKGLGQAARDALKPRGEALRATAVQADATRQNAQAPVESDASGQSEADDVIYRLMTPTGEERFDSERDYLTRYRAIVGPMFADGKARELLKFDQANKPLIAAVVGLADAVAAVNAEIRRPAGGLNV